MEQFHDYAGYVWGSFPACLLKIEYLSYCLDSNSFEDETNAKT